MSKIKITCDSTCDLPQEIIEKYDITVTPLYTVLGDNALRDGAEVVPADIYKFVDENGKLPKTSACSVDDYITTFKKYVDEGCEIIHFNLSSDMSSTHQNAKIAAGEVGNVYVVDTQNLSSGSGLLVLDACDMREEGMDAKSVYDELLRRVPLVRASFILDNLEYLKMGGRCSAVAMLGANVLKIKPRIEVRDGKMGMFGKYRGNIDKVAEKYVEDMLSTPDINTKRVFITHTNCPTEIIDAVNAKVRELIPFGEIINSRAGCVITSHCGPTCMGVLFEVQK